MRDDLTNLSKLGSAGTEYAFEGPSKEMLETFPSQYPHRDYTVTYATEEFTSLCPRTKQPDFAKVEITYVPDKLCVETKSLKLYLFAYRQVGSFMETVTGRVFEDLLAVLSPRKLRVRMSFAARGGITTDVVYEKGD